MDSSRPLSASRRAVLGVSASLLAGGAVAAPLKASPDKVAEAQRILERYQGFGDKASGGPGDMASGAWVEGELKAMGYAVARQELDTPAYEGEAPTLTAGEATATLIPQQIVATTPGIEGRLYVHGQGKGDIALIILPHGRWSSVVGPIGREVRAAASAGAKAVVIVTTGPAGEACALNTPVDKPQFDIPVAVMAPRDLPKFLAVAGAGGTARFRMAGRAFRRPGFNVTATLNRGHAKSLVLSTPRSGWFGCAGERGTGLAVWLMTARWAATAKLPVNLALVATTGHEYEYAGGEEFIAHVAPKPKDTALWAHLGANVAARDWHERGPTMSPLPSADPQHFLLVSPHILPAAKAAFAGIPGLEAPYAADPAQAAGELASILKGGYDPVMGIFGSHRFHHTRADDLRCVSADLIPPVVDAWTKTIAGALGKA